jgi:hypothetical protein
MCSVCKFNFSNIIIIIIIIIKFKTNYKVSTTKAKKQNTHKQYTKGNLYNNNNNNNTDLTTIKLAKTVNVWETNA